MSRRTMVSRRLRVAGPPPIPTLGGTLNPGGGGGGGVTGRWWSPNSPWNKLASTLAIDSNSTSIMNSLRSATSGNGIGFSGASYRPSVWTFSGNYTTWFSQQNAWFADNIPSPNFVIRSNGSEWHTAIIDDANDRIIGVYYSGIQPGTKDGSGRYLFRAISICRNSTGSGWWNAVAEGADRASGASCAGGLIRRSELAAGVISHALSLAMISGITSVGNPRLPATASDGTGTILPMGARLRINASQSLSAIQSALGLNNTQMIVVKALQDYGCFSTESSSSMALYTQNPLEGDGYDGTDPYGALGLIPASIFNYMELCAPDSSVVLDGPTTWNPPNPHH